MAYKVINLPVLATPTTSSTFAGPIGLLDDAASITIFMTSSSQGLTSGTVIQVSQFDPASTFPDAGITQSTRWMNLSTASGGLAAGVLTSVMAFTINNISFRGLRLSMVGSSDIAGEIIAYVSKQITVVIPLLLVPTLAAIVGLF